MPARSTRPDSRTRRSLLGPGQPAKESRTRPATLCTNHTDAISIPPRYSRRVSRRRLGSMRTAVGIFEGVSTRHSKVLAPRLRSLADVASCSGKKLGRPFQRFTLRLFLGCAGGSCQACAGRDIVGLAVIDIAQLITGEPALPAVHVHRSLGMILRAHQPLAAAAAPFSTGAPTRLPHSVQEPS